MISLSSVAPVFGNESSSGQAAGGHRRFDAQAVRQFADRIKVIEPQSSTAAIWWRWLMTRDLAFVTREIHKLIQSEGDLFAASDVLDDLGRFIDRNRADGQYSVIENQLVTMKLSQAISAVSASLKVNDMQANCIVAALSGCKCSFLDNVNYFSHIW